LGETVASHISSRVTETSITERGGGEGASSKKGSILCLPCEGASTISKGTRGNSSERSTRRELHFSGRKHLQRGTSSRKTFSCRETQEGGTAAEKGKDELLAWRQTREERRGGKTARFAPHEKRLLAAPGGKNKKGERDEPPLCSTQ